MPGGKRRGWWNCPGGRTPKIGKASARSYCYLRLPTGGGKGGVVGNVQPREKGCKALEGGDLGRIKDWDSERKHYEFSPPYASRQREGKTRS